jgi:hypothetical protein
MFVSNFASVTVDARVPASLPRQERQRQAGGNIEGGVQRPAILRLCANSKISNLLA